MGKFQKKFQPNQKKGGNSLAMKNNGISKPPFKKTNKFPDKNKSGPFTAKKQVNQKSPLKGNFKKPQPNKQANKRLRPDDEADSDVSISSYEPEAYDSSDIDSDDQAELKRLLAMTNEVDVSDDDEKPQPLKTIKADGKGNLKEKANGKAEKKPVQKTTPAPNAVKVNGKAEKRALDKTTPPAVAEKVDLSTLSKTQLKKLKKKENAAARAAANGINKPNVPVIVANQTKESSQKKPAEIKEPVNKKLKPNSQQEKNLAIPSKITKDNSKTTLKAESKVCMLSDTDSIVKEQHRRINDFYARSIYIRPIPKHCNPGMIKELVQEMVTCRIPKEKIIKGFAFVELKSAALVNKYVSSLNGKLFAGKPLMVAPAKCYQPPSISDYDTRSLFILGLSRDVKVSDLKAAFPKNKSIKHNTSQDGHSLGSAIVGFEEEKEALHAFQTQHGQEMKGHPICVTFRVNPTADRKPEKTEAEAKANVVKKDLVTKKESVKKDLDKKGKALVAKKETVKKSTVQESAAKKEESSDESDVPILEPLSGSDSDDDDDDDEDPFEGLDSSDEDIDDDEEDSESD